MYSEPVVKPVRKLLSDKGDPYTPLALCLTTVAPAKFCVLATIVDYFPKDINSSSDPYHSPNLPFTTDTNRYADGFTSSSNFDISSPHFPLYHGSAANTSQRYRYYQLYKESAAIQGVRLYGQGDAQAEFAKVKILDEYDYKNLPNPSKKFTVYAAIKWNPSSFAIQEGEHYNISVIGATDANTTQFWYDGGIKVGPNGYESYFDAYSNCYVGMGRCRPHLKKRRRIPSANWMSLSCAIGQFVRPLVDPEPGFENLYRWLPLDESELIPTVFNVGEFIEFRAVYTGELICFANDAHTLYWNNRGSIAVTVTRVSWPPINSTYYEELLLPSCDSAQVVYVNHGINTGEGKIKCNPNGGGSGWTESEILYNA
eukprot:gene20863-27040_t